MDLNKCRKKIITEFILLKIIFMIGMYNLNGYQIKQDNQIMYVKVNTSK